MKLTDTELDELLRLAKDATPGPWIKDTIAECDSMIGPRNEDTAVCMVFGGPKANKHDHEYIAHANPERITRLVECVKELKAALEYYGDYQKWLATVMFGQFCTIPFEDIGETAGAPTGGKRAREALAKWFGEAK